MTRATIAVAAIILVGCTVQRRAEGVIVPGAGVNPDLVDAHCESQEHFQDRVRYFRRLMDVSGARYIPPQVGIPVCDLMAALGVPNERREEDQREDWVYETGSPEAGTRTVHFVTIEPDTDGRWVVASVAW